MSDADRSEGASWWALACRFLDRFAAVGAGHPNLRADDRFDAWMVRVHRVGDLLDAREAHEPWPWPGLADALEALVAGDVEPGDAAHAVAWAIDERFARTFPDDWIADGAVERLGVNVLLVPAMSTKTSNFPLAAGRLLHTAQTLTVVANGPLVDDRGASIAHCSMTARPTVGLSLVSWPPGGSHAAPAGPVWVAHPLDKGPPSAHVLP